MEIIEDDLTRDTVIALLDAIGRLLEERGITLT
jgi:hypothetical protein